MIARLLAAYEEGEELRTHAMVVGQAWRDGRRQAMLARLLHGTTIVAIDESLGRRSGELLAKAKTSDPIDGAIVLVARDGESVVTGDADDLQRLARVARRRVLIVPC